MYLRYPQKADPLFAERLRVRMILWIGQVKCTIFQGERQYGELWGTAGPPDKITVNQKGIKRIRVRNIINGTMTTNSQLPLRLNGPSRRFFALWSNLNTRNSEGQITKKWEEYWNIHWEWMKGEGWEYVLH